ncbi:proline-rich 33 kDa extensin-related protein-like isoform X4 [Gouania willdenowi]|uniref:proline-rich 33 kDa extensin-related protein-like isoform X4 n=1 Tax=Gouania willdenowi TaxID=441366 RepID=UPI00105412F1|nr:proline-rich 33 kDa extensin-related protein-like isoform X4 [Gouania willdenowi]
MKFQELPLDSKETHNVPPTSLIRPPADTRRKLHEPLVDGTLPPSETSSALHTHEPTHTGPSVVVPPLTRGPDPHTTETPHTGPSAIVPPPTREPDPHTPETPHTQRPDQDISSWNCWKVWIRTELQSLGLWPRSYHLLKPGNVLSLWHLPPLPELIVTLLVLPSCNFFQLYRFLHKVGE